jgi:GGDEF domain-containing protein
VEQKYSIHILGEEHQTVEKIASVFQNDVFAVETSITPGLDKINVGSNFDAYVVCLPEGFQPIRENRQGTVIPPNANVVFITSGNFDSVRFWAYQQGASDVISWPTDSIEIAYRISASIAQDADRFHRGLTEEKMLSLARYMIESGYETLTPSIDYTMPNGFYYPLATQTFGRTPFQAVALEQMASFGIFTRSVVNRIRTCTTCSSAQLNYREVCSQCNSIDVEKTDTLHHFSCGFVGAVDKFRKGADLECPKCSVTVRHIGVDYERLAIHYHCNTCDHLAAEPKIETQCMRCTALAEPHDTSERPIYEYAMTETAAVAVEEGRLSGLKLETVLRGGNLGLYTAQYFEHELSREMTRSIRYKSPYCVLLIRIDNLDIVRSNHAEKAYQYINQVFGALNQVLRELDTTCVWELDTLGVVLSSTPKEGGKLVVNKMQGYLKELDHLLSVQEPKITVSLMSDEESHETAESLLNAATAELES